MYGKENVFTNSLQTHYFSTEKEKDELITELNIKLNSLFEYTVCIDIKN